MRDAQNILHRWLRWSERYMKTDMVYLTKGGFWLAAGQLVQMVLGFSSAVIFANYLPAELYGNFRYILSITAIIASFSLNGITTAVSGAAARGNDSALPVGFRVIFTWSWVMVLAGAVAGIYYFTQGNTLLGFALLMAGAANPILVASTVYDAYFEGKKIFRDRILYSIIRNTVPVLGVAATVMLTDDLVLILAVYFILNTSIAYLLYRRVLHYYTSNTKSEEGTVRYGIHISAINFIGTLTTNIDRVLMFQMVGATPLAVFSFAQAPLNYIQTAFQILKTMMFPKFANRSMKEIREGSLHKVFRLFVVVACGTIVYILLAPYFFYTFFPTYTDSIVISQVLALITLASPTIVFSQTLLAHKREYELYVLRITVLVVKCAILLALIPLYGLWGAVFAALISKMVESSLLTYLFFKIPALDRDRATVE